MASAVVGALVGTLTAPGAAAAVKPGARQLAAMAASGPGKLVLFGGVGPTDDVQGDTWVWNGTTWRRMRPESSPPPRQEHAMASDPATGTVVLFGGTGDGGGSLGDTWIWNPRDKTWTNATPLPPAASPRPHSYPLMAYDAVSRKVVLLLVGELSETWTWDGESRTWLLASPGREGQPSVPLAMAYDRARRQVVLFEQYGTWLWDPAAGAWTRHATTTTPSTRAFPGMAYDAKRKRVVLFGGNRLSGGLSDETWTWNGDAWTKESPSRRPSPRARLSMAYHAQSERVVLFGGRAGETVYGDTWTYAANWRHVA